MCLTISFSLLTVNHIIANNASMYIYLYGWCTDMTRLEYIITSKAVKEIDADTLLVFATKKDERPVLPEYVKRLVGEVLDDIINAKEFRGDEGEVYLLRITGKFKRVVLAGLGSSPSYESIRLATAGFINRLASTKAEKILVDMNGADLGGLDDKKALMELIIISEMTLYDPGEPYKTKDKKELSIKEVIIKTEKGEELTPIVEKAKMIADAVNYARRIADAPANYMNPEKIEEEAKKLAKEYGLKIKVYRYKDLEKMGMNGIIAVGKGSSIEPRLVILEYRGREGDDWDYAFIGKTVTFDAGGLNLKPTGYIDEMKYDKSGGAAVLGIIKAVASLKLPLNIIGALPAVENLPGPTATKPKDIVKMYNGMTIEVGNTDAEGRIILADTLSYIDKNYKPKLMFDLATLTGAIVIALGNYAAGLFTENDEVAEKLYKLGLETGERVWRMPLWKEYYDQLKSEFADINNIGGRPAGAITAAAFLSHFVEDKNKWVHLDIAGTAWVQRGHPKKPYYKPAATGFGVRLLTYYLLDKHGFI